MKSHKLVFLLPVFFLNYTALFSSTPNEKLFVKGNISEKIKILESLTDAERVPIIQKGLDFSIENASVLGPDEEFTNLTVASINALLSEPEKIKKIKKKERLKLSEKLMTVFKQFKDNRVREAAMEKLPLYSESNKDQMVAFLNDYLATSFKTGEKEENVLEQSIVIAGENGNSESLTIIYNIWHSRIWPQYQSSCDEALVLLSQDSFSDVIKIFSISNIKDSAHYLSLLKKSSKIPQNSLCDIAENALLIAINNVEKLRASDEEKKAFSDFQLEAHEILTENKWSHAASVVNTNILFAKKAFEDGSMTAKEFVKMINSSVQVPSPALAQSLTEMLSECNGKFEKNELLDKSVVLALITALGELGDKTAFDTLLYVTYLSYPLEVLDEAKKSLAKLNW